MPKAMENKKISTKTHLRTPWGIKSYSTLKRGVQDYLVLVSKIDLLVGVSKIKTNQVLGLPLTISTRRVEPVTSKEMVSEKVWC